MLHADWEGVFLLLGEERLVKFLRGGAHELKTDEVDDSAPHSRKKLLSLY